MGGIKKKSERYRQIIAEILKSEARDFPDQSELEDQVILDWANDHYQLLRIGWLDDDRILQILIHVDIKPDGKVWIQETLTELALDDELVKRGIPASEIVLGMHPPSYRQFTEFAES